MFYYIVQIILIILYHTICYIQDKKRFERRLIDQWYLLNKIGHSITTIVFFYFMSAKALSAMQPLSS